MLCFTNVQARGDSKQIKKNTFDKQLEQAGFGATRKCCRGSRVLVFDLNATEIKTKLLNFYKLRELEVSNACFETDEMTVEELKAITDMRERVQNKEFEY